MGLPFSGSLDSWPCGCDPGQGTNPTGTGVPYVISLNGLGGLVTLAAGGGVSISSIGNSILIASDGSAGLGTVTTVNATSSNTNLVVTGGPVTTVGTFAFSLAGALNSISGLVTAANKMIYTTALDTYAVTDLTAFARTLLDDAASSDARSTLGLVIGTNVQAWSADLDAFVTNASWSGANLTLAGNVSAVAGNFSGNVGVTGTLGVAGLATLNGGISTGSISAATISGDGSGITGLSASNISSGTLAVARGGTNIASYTVGDLLYASGATTLSKLADVPAGSFLRSGGVATAPVWSTTLWPNTLVTGDILYASSTTQVSRLANVATGNVLLSGGVGVASSFGKVTSSHVNSTIPTMSGGVSSDLTGFSSNIAFALNVDIGGNASFSSAIIDASTSAGSTGQLLTTDGNTIAWSSQASIDTFRIDTSLSMEATITAGGVTGDQTINKPLGSVNIAAGGSSITVTNSLATANTCVFCQIATNDSTAIIKNVVSSSGQFVIRTTAAVTAETRINFVLFQPT